MPGQNEWISLRYDERSLSCELDFSRAKILQKEEAIDFTISEIIKDFGTNLYVSLSGGMDSEFVAQCLLERRIPFKPVIVDYASNGVEVWNAYNWCQQNNLDPFVIKLEQHHMNHVLPFYAKKFKVAYVSAIDFIIDAVVGDGKIITGSPEPFVRIDALTDRLDKSASTSLYFNTFDFPLQIAYPGKHPGGFFSYTPSLLCNMVKTINYEKPIQLALAEYYGVRARPKIPAAINTLPYIHVSSQTNSSVPLYAIDLGTRETFLSCAESGGVLRCPYSRI